MGKQVTCTSCSESRFDGGRREEGNLSVVIVTLVRAAIGAFATGSRVQADVETGCTMHATCEVRELGMPCRLLELRLPVCLCREGNETKRKRRERRQAGRQTRGREGSLAASAIAAAPAATHHSLFTPSLGAAFTNFHHSPAFPCLYKAPGL